MRYALAGAALLGLVLLAGCEKTKQFVIRSVPEGATVVIDKQRLPRTTPLNHTLRFRQNDDRWDTHLIRVIKPGYKEDSWVVHYADAPNLMFFLVKKPSE